jgi:PKD repeat protein
VSLKCPTEEGHFTEIGLTGLESLYCIALRRISTILTLLLLARGVHAQDLQKGLIGCYSFSGNADDGSGHNRNGTVVGPLLAPDRFGNPNSAYQFNAAGHIVIPRDSVPQVHWTFAVWVKFISLPSLPAPPTLEFIETPIVSSLSTGIFLQTSHSQNEIVTFYLYGGYAPGIQGAIPLDEWTHLVSMGDGQGLKMYINGVSVLDTTGFTYTPTAPQVYEQQEIIIGVSFDGGDHSVDSLKNIIDDVAIYDRALTFTEVKLLYQGGLPCTPQSPPITSIHYLCGSDTVVVTAAGGSVYRWYDASSGGDLLLEGNRLIAVVPSGSTDYYVSKVTNGIEGMRKKVTVTPAPPPQLACTIPPGGLTQGSMTFSSSASSGVIPYTYAFDFGDGSNVSVDSSAATHSYASRGSYIVTVTVTDAHQCSAMCADSIQIVSLPVVKDVSICAGSSATLTASGGYDYRWYDAETGGNLLSQQNPFITPPLSSQTVYYVAVLVDGTESTRTKVTVSIFPQPQVVCIGPDDALMNSLVTISATITSGTSPFQYLYEINGIPQASSASPTLSFQNNQASDYNFDLTVTDINNCTGSCSHSLRIFEPFIPNVITVNGDLLNDHLTVFEKTGDHYEPYDGSIPFSMTVINRYGKQVYSTTDPATGWDGQGADSGVYYYDIAFGSDRFKGWVSVIK